MLDYIRAQTPPEKQQLIDELFAKIVLYDNRRSSPPVPPSAPTASTTCTSSTRRRKTESDGLGKETPLALDDWIEVGVFARKAGEGEHTEKPLYLEPQRITQDKGTIDVVSMPQPFEVAVDPYNKLIDRNPDDNRKRSREVRRHGEPSASRR